MAELNNLFQFYLQHQDDIVKEYDGKYVVLHDNKVQGAFSTDFDAVSFGEKKFPSGSFLVQKCSSGKKDYSQTYHSRVYFGG